MKYVIMAAGAGTRWNNYLGIPKHLVKINGETLLERTTRLLKENGITDYVITGNDERYKKYGTLIPQTDQDCEIDRYEESIVSGTVCYLYGDVYYTEEAIKTIISNKTNNILFFGSHAEIFAIKVVNTKLFFKHKHRVKKLFLNNKIDRCIGWEIYKSLHHLPWIGVQITDDYIYINDETDDLDYPDDYENFKQKIKMKQRNWIINCISVIIPCYNNAGNTKYLIDKLLKQKKDYPETEIIVIENGSTEDMSFLDSYNPNDVIILHEKTVGVSHARNVGLDKARGEYIAFIDNDDDISNNYLHLLYRKMRENNSYYDYCIIPSLTDGKILMDYSTLDITNPLPKIWCVWHYCYNRRIIKDYRFDESLKVKEDIIWLNHIIPRNKINNGTIINDNAPIYFYKFANNENSLSHKFNRGEIKID